MSDFGEVTVERLERGLMIAAYVVARHGAVYAPLFDRLERDLAELRTREDPVARARHHLKTHSMDLDWQTRLNAISPPR